MLVQSIVTEPTTPIRYLQSVNKEWKDVACRSGTLFICRLLSRIMGLQGALPYDLARDGWSKERGGDRSFVEPPSHKGAHASKF